MSYSKNEFIVFDGNNDPYKILNSKTCHDDSIGNYATLALAKSACNVNSNCRGVFDQSCDFKNTFYLCPVSKALKYAADFSCVHEKIGGKLNFQVYCIYVIYIISKILQICKDFKLSRSKIQFN